MSQTCQQLVLQHVKECAYIVGGAQLGRGRSKIQPIYPVTYRSQPVLERCAHGSSGVTLDNLGPVIYTTLPWRPQW